MALLSGVGATAGNACEWVEDGFWSQQQIWIEGWWDFDPDGEGGSGIPVYHEGYWEDYGPPTWVDHSHWEGEDCP